MYSPLVSYAEIVPVKVKVTPWHIYTDTEGTRRYSSPTIRNPALEGGGWVDVIIPAVWHSTQQEMYQILVLNVIYSNAL